jgi:hypothetical protein
MTDIIDILKSHSPLNSSEKGPEHDPTTFAVAASLISSLAPSNILFITVKFTDIIGTCPLPPIVYGLYPALFSMEKLSRKRGNEYIVIELRLLTKLFIVLAPVLVYCFIFLFIVPVNGRWVETSPGWYLSNSAAAAIIGVFLRFATQVGKKEFRFYFAKGCCEIMLTKAKDVEKMKYLYLLLDSYNRYLRRNLKFEIKDINKIYSTIIYTGVREEGKKRWIMKTICDSFTDNGLELARFLSTISKVPEGELFGKESLFQQLKTVGSFLFVAIPIVISIIQLVMPRPE